MYELRDLIFRSGSTLGFVTPSWVSDIFLTWRWLRWWGLFVYIRRQELIYIFLKAENVVGEELDLTQDVLGHLLMSRQRREHEKN